MQNEREIAKPFASEKVNNYEIGIKTSNRSNRFFANAAFFYMDYRDMQIPIIFPDGSGQATTNAGRSRIFGLEVDFAAYLSDRLAISGGVGLNDAEYIEYQFDIPGPTGTTTVDRSGDKISTIPTFNGTLAADYFIPLNDKYRLSLRAQFRYRGEVNATEAVPDEIVDAFNIGALALLNGRIALESDQFSLYLFGNNLLNNEYLTSAFVNTLFATPFEYQANRIGEPRFLGIGLSYNFGK